MYSAQTTQLDVATFAKAVRAPRLHCVSAAYYRDREEVWELRLEGGREKPHKSYEWQVQTIWLNHLEYGIRCN